MSPKTFGVGVKHLGTAAFPSNAILRLLRLGRLCKTQPKIEMVTCLIEHGFRTSGFDDYETKELCFPLFNAVALCNIDLIMVLIKYGAQVTDTDKHRLNDTPLHIIAVIDLPGADIVGTARLLIELGADVNAVSNVGRTPLHALCDSVAPPETLRSLLDLYVSHGAKINAVDRHGRIPLLLLAQSSAPLETVIALLDRHLTHGVDINTVDSQGDTVISLLLYWNKTVRTGNAAGRDDKSRPWPEVCRILQHLSDAGARFDVRSKSGWSVLSYAQQWLPEAIPFVKSRVALERDPASERKNISRRDGKESTWRELSRRLRGKDLQKA
ncbi:hypothetical protein H2200_006370 [Cladophialophora chaetospira]|uniref:Ankyrin n=1 Tax=Cladophialophora chaetospira TaxID=386627 RepID=A0AA38XB05_9EURO|nr:hypothetical protein H2200_006370 [Cladophialophora chaetospira]